MATFDFKAIKAKADSLKGEYHNFRSRIRNLKKWQKILLLVIAIFVPAGIAIASLIVLKMKAKRQ